MTETSLESPFLDEMEGRLLRSIARARELTADLDEARLNWKPAADKWSVAQCLEHIDAAAEKYLEQLTPAVGRAQEHRKHPANGAPPRHTLVGRFILMLVEPNAKRTMKTPKMFAPSQSAIKPDVIERFVQTHETLLETIRACKALNVNRVKLGTPEVTFIRINAADAIKVLVTHAERHLRQAERMRQSIGRWSNGTPDFEVSRNYYGFLQYKELDSDKFEKLSDLADTYPLLENVTKNWLEVNYKGRDSSRFVIRVLSEIAQIIGDAEGEVVLDQWEDGLRAADAPFVYYTISNHKLYRQPARIVRGERVEVLEPLKE